MKTNSSLAKLCSPRFAEDSNHSKSAISQIAIAARVGPSEQSQGPYRPIRAASPDLQLVFSRRLRDATPRTSLLKFSITIYGRTWPKPRESRQWRWDGARSTSDERGVWRSRHSPWPPRTLVRVICRASEHPEVWGECRGVVNRTCCSVCGNMDHHDCLSGSCDGHPSTSGEREHGAAAQHGLSKRPRQFKTVLFCSEVMGGSHTSEPVRAPQFAFARATMHG